MWKEIKGPSIHALSLTSASAELLQSVWKKVHLRYGTGVLQIVFSSGLQDLFRVQPQRALQSRKLENIL